MVKDLLRRYAAAGMTIFMSTDTLAVAEEIADRIGILDGGRLQFLGTLSELQRELSSHHTSLEALFLQLTECGSGGKACRESENSEVARRRTKHEGSNRRPAASRLES